MRAVLVCALLVALAGCSVGFQGDPGGDPVPATADASGKPGPTPGETATASLTTTPMPGETATTSPTPTPTPGETATPTASPTTTPTADAPEPPAEGGTTDDSPAGDGDGDGPLAGLFDPPEDRPGIDVRGGELPVDATLVYRRTSGLLAVDVPPPGTVRVLDTTVNTTQPPEFHRLLGLESNVSEVEAAAFVVNGRTVFVGRNTTSDPAFTEHVLAHEFTHTVQFRLGAIGAVRTATGGGPDGRFASTAVIEGAATYTQDAYWRTYMADRTDADRRGERPAELVGSNYRNATGATQYAFAPYWFGYRYANATVDSPADLDRLYADPPRTAEAVLHRLPPGTESPVPLAVRYRGADEGTWQRTFAPLPGRMGEAFLRVALATELPDDRAAAAATGWGNDTRVAFANETNVRGYVWVLRFDAAADATEFDAAVRDYLDGRGARTADGSVTWRARVDGRPVAYRVVRPDDRTAALLVGAPAFVRTTTVEGGNGTVTVVLD